MIKVTVGEQKTHRAIPFPKLMTCNNGWIGYFIEYGKCVWISGEYEGVYAERVRMEGITDLNDPITLQNVLP